MAGTTASIVPTMTATATTLTITNTTGTSNSVISHMQNLNNTINAINVSPNVTSTNPKTPSPHVNEVMKLLIFPFLNKIISFS